ncbi:MAG TPA: RagB/SusD family nutrient uptake outer membrane protein [Puia sp.]
MDKAPGVDVTEDTIFSSQAQVETLITGIYNLGVHNGYPFLDENYRTNMDGIEAGCTDEGECTASWFWPNSTWNVGNINQQNGGSDFRWTDRWNVIRKCNIVLERIDGVPNTPQSYKDQVTGEVKFLRALAYFEMLKFYGGVPIVDKRFQLSDDLKVGRNSVEDVVNFIVKNCDEAAALLPDVYPATLRGRATKGADLMLKSRTLLYAASPLFNTGTPYLSMSDAGNNKFVCYGNYDVTRWQAAADAAKAVLDWAPHGGIALITDQGVDKNYKYMWERTDNNEIIFASQRNGLDGSAFGGMAPPVPPINALCGITVWLNFVQHYEKKDGTPQTWDMNGGNDLNEKYDELDPRFKQTLSYNGAFWNTTIPNMQTYTGGQQSNLCFGGVWLKKAIPDEWNNTSSQVSVNWTVFRLAEAYLNYAEALNEAQGPVPEAYDAVNTIRERSGMPDLPTGLSQSDFRLRVQNERTVELAYEEHRFWDVRRWLIAENDGIMNGTMWGLTITPYPAPVPDNTDFSYLPYAREVRVFSKREYLHPFPNGEMLKGYLVQNPGY